MRHFPARLAALLPIAACLLLSAPPPLVLAQSRPLAPEPQFPAGPMPAGDVSFRDLHFQPLDFTEWPALLSRLKISYHDETVTIADVGREMPVITVPGEDRGTRRTAVWSGPASEASFVQETVGGVHTLKDRSGKVLWSDAADIAAPDLLFVKTEDGEARLTDKAGATLWAGHLPHIKAVGVSSRLQSDRVSIIAPSICIEGVGGVFRVTSGRLLWTGRLPPSPLILIRDGNTFMVVGPNCSDSGTDQTSRISMEYGAETVTVADAAGRTLGTQAVDALTVHHTMRASFLPRGTEWPAEHKSQDGRLDATGTLLLTYRDSTGRVVRRSKITKDAQGNTATFN